MIEIKFLCTKICAFSYQDSNVMIFLYFFYGLCQKIDVEMGGQLMKEITTTRGDISICFVLIVESNLCPCGLRKGEQGF